MSDDICEDCAGMGHAVKRINRNRRGRISSVEFDLTKPCPTCGGKPVGSLTARCLTAISRENPTPEAS